MINAVLYCAKLLTVLLLLIITKWISPKKQQQEGYHPPHLYPKYITAVSVSRRLCLNLVEHAEKKSHQIKIESAVVASNVWVGKTCILSQVTHQAST